ncbi:low-specificity L-threonine aldolase [Hydrogenophaga sp. BPS33]|uniref:low-specificity L-threonine aldolase n=1 Tax=Hydrogenophaga sp. BPS33 TaxID=2651974 RepID=UPI00131F70BC|nr:low-specificity L-threonine aldolase [Hydrogenophaga sp. BPS33]QHE87637.1 low-specificity L-threonine aldolase [Hydrogenophaga sp. BPS33]
MNPIIDLRSDTLTQPTPAMRDAMARAPLGDDGYGEDPTVNALQDKVAALLGFEAALFMPTGTQANLCAILAHCGRGDEYIVGQQAHCYRWEGGGAAMLGGVQPQPLEHEADGRIGLAGIADAVKPPGDHCPTSRLLALENTLGGKVLPEPYLDAACALAAQQGLSTHLDGARLFNAAVYEAQTLGLTPLAQARRIAGHFDSVAVCFSKGLGAPAGSALCGSAAFIARARRLRRTLGGTMRQTGVLAAAALFALDHHVSRLAEDHRLAQRLHAGLAGLDGLHVEAPMTNVLFLELRGGHADKTPQLIDHLRQRSVWVSGQYRLRLVTHMDVDASSAERVVGAFREFLDA